MSTIIDWAINSITYATIAGFIISFVHYCWQRAANKSAAAKFWGTIDREFWQTNLAPRQPEPAAELTPEQWDALTDLGPDVATGELTTDEAVAIVSYAPKASPQPPTLVIRNEPDLSDEALIRWAKQMKFPGSNKWGFNRRLSQKVRSELLGLMEG